MKWQSIKTAPKDGREILVYHKVAGFMSISYWEDGVGWVKASEDGFDAFNEEEQPTHWMPVPEPPD